MFFSLHRHLNKILKLFLQVVGHVASRIAHSPTSEIFSVSAEHFEGVESSLPLIHCGVSCDCFMCSDNLEYVCFIIKSIRKQKWTKPFRYACPQLYETKMCGALS